MSRCILLENDNDSGNRDDFGKSCSYSFGSKHGLYEVVESFVDASFYRMIVGSLQYLTLARPDITHAVNLASHFMQSPNIEHLLLLLPKRER